MTRKSLAVWLAGLAMLAAPAAAIEIHSKHCLHGCPYGGDTENNLIVRESYILLSNDLTRLADWVAYRVSRDTIGAPKQATVTREPVLRPNETLEPEDYRGARRAIATGPGYYAPLTSFAATPHWRETTFLANIAPRKTALGRGPWLALEKAVRRLALESSVKAVYVIAGPIFERAMIGLPGADEQHVMPSGFWKIVAVRNGSGARVTAFAFDQDTPQASDYCRHRTTVQYIVQKTAYTFFHHLNGKLSALDAALGC